MSGKEGLQHAMFSGELVDNRTEAQKRRAPIVAAKIDVGERTAPLDMVDAPVRPKRRKNTLLATVGLRRAGLAPFFEHSSQP